VRAVSLHPDVIVATSRVLFANCTIVRSSFADVSGQDEPRAETFVVDSPILPDELELLPSLLEQAGFSQPSGLLATHADWDHLLGPLAFPKAALGCAESSAERLAREPGTAQRELRAFDEGLYLQRPRPLALGAPQALAVPGRCEIGARELELHPACGHTPDGMAIHVPWARTVIAGDYCSSIEIPTIAASAERDTDSATPLSEYLTTLDLLAGLLETCDHLVPGHGPVLDAERARQILAEDRAYLEALEERGAKAELPQGRRSREQRRLHAENARRL
jgi:glyoxylase-like metal-dependent hydrolase (beta-lactamase superfamily II)